MFARCAENWVRFLPGAARFGFRLQPTRETISDGHELLHGGSISLNLRRGVKLSQSTERKRYCRLLIL